MDTASATPEPSGEEEHGGPPPGGESGPAERPPRQGWRYPPLGTGVLGVLYALTGGFYVVRHAWRLSAELRPGKRAWPAGLLALVPLVGLLVLSSLAQETKRVAERRGVRVAWSPGTLVLLQLGANGVSLGLGLYKSGTPHGALLAGVLAGLPWVLVQRALDRIKRASRRPLPASPRFGFGAAQAVCAALFGAMLLLAAWAVYLPRYKRSTGDPLAAGSRVTGPKGGYYLTPPSDGWVRVPPGTSVDAASDLELYGRSTLTQAAVYVYEDGNLDGTVDDRRHTLQGISSPELRVEDERGFARGEPYVQQSIARYSGKINGQEARWFVVTAAPPGRIVEVVAWTLATSIEAEEAEDLAKSLAVAQAEAP